MAEEQTDGRRKNGAAPGGKPDASTSKKACVTTGLERESAGPDGPDAGVVGETFKRKP
ncbi:hypothetical protein [Brevundimonas goettingensis]|uniref:Uncharacterized protein n=1 Tax=Brevundimonas goettingensis TaxID=2774190 RepID=A0A975C821_9CAUL|nr:hypothetical protein [Brevundimonas goettingensis]QTC92886.1 hypothetical protein IFJ75_08595 [Brevundimonas goettingensis]